MTIRYIPSVAHTCKCPDIIMTDYTGILNRQISYDSISPNQSKEAQIINAFNGKVKYQNYILQWEVLND